MIGSASSVSLAISDSPLVGDRERKEVQEKKPSNWNRFSKVLVISGLFFTVVGLATSVGVIAKLRLGVVVADTDLEHDKSHYYLQTDAGLTTLGKVAVAGLATFAGGVVFVMGGTAAALIDFNNKRD